MDGRVRERIEERERERKDFKRRGKKSVATVGRWESSLEEGRRKEKKRKRKINILLLLNWPDIRPAPNGAQKLQKIENIILRRNMKTVCRNSIRFAN